MRRKSLSEKDIRTILAVMECFQEQNKWQYDEMNKVMGSITIEEMLELQTKLDKWYRPERYEEDYDPEEYAESYQDYISSYIY